PLPGGDQVTINANRQERDGAMFHLRGAVEVLYRDMKLTADEIDYNDETQILEARGNLHFEATKRDENIYAEHGTYNLLTSTGQFYVVHGTAGAHISGKNVALTTTNPFFFEAPRADRVSETE